MFSNKFVGKIINYLPLIAILIVAAFLRLYKISEYMTFLGDEGRDMIIVKGILEGKLTLLGPRASAGDFFTGPIYYYFMAPFVWLFKFDPMGPAVMVALFGVVTVFLVYFFGKYLFNKKTAFIAASLYAISPLVIAYSRSSWNPNPTPFFSLLMLFLLYKSIEKFNIKFLLVAGILFGISMQLHYQALWLGAVIFFFTFFSRYYIDKKIIVSSLVKYYLHLFIGFVIGFSPFLAFEIRHGFPNIRTIINVAFGSASQGEANVAFSSIIQDVFFRIFARLLIRFPPPEQLSVYYNLQVETWRILIIIFAALSIMFVIRVKNKLVPILFCTWLFVGVFMFGFYKKPIYDYYFQFLFPLPFLLLGNFLSTIYEYKANFIPIKSKILEPRKIRFLSKIIAAGAVIFLIYFNLQGTPFLFPPNRQKDQVKKIADFVLSKTDNKPFNFALITLGNSDHGYRYFFELANRKPAVIQNPMIDPERKTVTDQLLIICEDRQCQPLGNPLWEVAGFGMAEVADEWDISVVKIYKLKHLGLK
ncbi:hypothetical protein C4577_05330 [Candidatus Parcubacteria bacterium]|nr:MAG: hypothetical protein C4577_05330 [Candidatus Parcubacteria bacterium]